MTCLTYNIALIHCVCVCVGGGGGGGGGGGQRTYFCMLLLTIAM